MVVSIENEAIDMRITNSVVRIEITMELEHTKETGRMKGKRIEGIEGIGSLITDSRTTEAGIITIEIVTIIEIEMGMMKGEEMIGMIGMAIETKEIITEIGSKNQSSRQS